MTQHHHRNSTTGSRTIQALFADRDEAETLSKELTALGFQPLERSDSRGTLIRVEVDGEADAYRAQVVFDRHRGAEISGHNLSASVADDVRET